jgi:hypothetical protein
MYLTFYLTSYASYQFIKRFKTVAFFGMSKKNNYLGRLFMVIGIALFEAVIMYKLLGSLYLRGIMDPF